MMRGFSTGYGDYMSWKLSVIVWILLLLNFYILINCGTSESIQLPDCFIEIEIFCMFFFCIQCDLVLNIYPIFYVCIYFTCMYILCVCMGESVYVCFGVCQNVCSFSVHICIVAMSKIFKEKTKQLKNVNNINIRTLISIHIFYYLYTVIAKFACGIFPTQ